MNLRPRQKQPFIGFTKAEVEKMEQLFDESNEQSLDENFYKKLARSFNCSSNRAGKPILKWTEVQSWFQKKRKNSLLNEGPFDSKQSPIFPYDFTQDKATENPEFPKGEKGRDISKLEFEAKSSKDGAWYDVDTFLSHRFVGPGEVEVYVRYTGFGTDEDEWVNAKHDVRERSIALEHSECNKVNAGDLIVCFQERHDQARYYDAHVMSIQRRLHDIRGCRCLFLIRYDHDKSEERVPLTRLYCRPNLQARLEST
ncbi:Protein SAWADEE HOMEODOMAIN HOMOLOG 1 [Striga hermonthica]|uniref:Protein SAWADEE HOMEODOMAIN HOMOLOG 1 n=1 Tax=Striga hermonthica TaxID=68872 RepID=A0A9N7N643_STRHE|nr:Protein SAWADEE HOMEODOMAIN HOMOLOG 1 [Striga hermonthica]